MSDGAEAAARLVGSTFAGRYRVVQLLRSGGISDVYLAEQMTLRPGPLTFRGADEMREEITGEGRGSNPDVGRGSSPDLPRAGGSEPPRAGRAARLAIKVLRERFRGDRAVARRFERGVVAASQVVHPNVVLTGPIERLPDGLPFCTMELLIGLDLADMLAYGRKLDPARALRIAEGAAAGLSAAHAAGVLHLDVKPENVFVVHRPDGGELVKILDFGLASIAGDPAAPRVEAACGTPEYMAPEQKRGGPAAPTMDVYALGVVLFEMLTGLSPAGPRASSVDLPPRLARVVMRALAADPADRHPTMEAFRAALAEAAEEGLPAGLASEGR